MTYKDQMVSDIGRKMAEAMRQRQDRDLRVMAASLLIHPVRLPFWQRIRVLFGRPLSLSIDMEGELYSVEVTVG